MKSKMKSKKFPILFIVFILCLFSCILPALDPNKPFKSYKHSILELTDKLKSETVSCIVQDKNHYIWFVVLSGLIRYNGNSIITYDHNNTPELYDDRIRSIFADSQGQLWIIKRGGGLSKFYNDTFTNFTDKDDLYFSKVVTITETKSGKILFGSKGGIIIKDREDFSFIPLKGKAVLDEVSAIMEDHSGKIWIGTNNGLYTLNLLNGAKIESIDKMKDIAINAIVEDMEHKIWVGTTKNGIGIINGSIIQFITTNGTANDYIRHLYKDSHDVIWAATFGGGLQRFYNGKTETFDQKMGLSVNSVLSLCEDHEGTLWIGTSGGGLNRLSDLNVYTYTELNGYKFDNVFGIYQDKKGTIWISAFGKGLFSLSKNGNVRRYGVKDRISSTGIFAFTETNDGSLWLGSHMDGIFRIKNGKIKQYGIESGLNSNTILGLYLDSRNRLWAVTTEGGIYTYGDNNFILVKNVSVALSIIKEDKKGNIWIGSIRDKLFCFDGRQMTTYTKEDGFDLNIISSIHVTAENCLLVGTIGGGLNIFKNGVVKHLNETNGLPDNNINSIIDDNIDSYWMGSDVGIIQLKKEILKDFIDGKITRISARTFGSDDGMKSLNCYGGFQSSGFRADDGKIWIPTSNGISVVDPARVHINLKPPNVFIEKIMLNDKEMKLTDKIIIPPGKNRIEFHYIALSFINSAKLNYKYKMEGYDERWVNAGNRNIAYYTNLPSGEYSFKVIACNNDNIWNIKGDTISIRQKPFFYNTIWAYVCYILIVLVAIIVVYKIRVRKLVKRKKNLESIIKERTFQLQALNKKLDKIVKERTRELEKTNKKLLLASQVKSQILANVSHELRTPLAVIMGYTECLLVNRKNRAKLNLNQTLNKIVFQSRQLLRMVESLLNVEALESKTLKLNLSLVDINKVVGQVRKQLLVNLQEGDTLKLELDKNIYKYYLDENKVYQIIRNVLDNSIKFSPDRKDILVITLLERDFVVIKCRDRGIGIPKSNINKIYEPFFQVDASCARPFNGAGLGLYITKAMVHLHKGQILTISTFNKGTTVEIKLPTNLSQVAVNHRSKQPAERPLNGHPKALRKVLVVDDNMDIPELIQIFFKNEYLVYSASDGKEAIVKAQKIKPNVILMDLAMPGMDGYEATEKIKKHKILHNIPVIALSARNMPEEIEHSLRSGCIAHLGKPFDKDKLRGMIEKYCRN